MEDVQHVTVHCHKIEEQEAQDLLLLGKNPVETKVDPEPTEGGLTMTNSTYKNNQSIVVDLDSGEESCVTLTNQQGVKGRQKRKQELKEEEYVQEITISGIINKRAKAGASWRPKGINYRKTHPSIKATVNGCEIHLRQCRSYVMFEISSMTVLMAKCLPLRIKFEEFSTMVAEFSKARRPQMTAEAKPWRHDYLSWKAFKHFLEHNLTDHCLKDLLRTYAPHDTESKFEGSLGVGKAPVKFLGSEKDFLKIAGVTIPFAVSHGRVYFDLLAAFTIMGQLQVALKNDWREIDVLLENQGFDLKMAFRINSHHSLDTSKRSSWKSQRSAIMYEALKALVLSNAVPNGQRKERLMAILDHLDADMMGMSKAREDLIFKVQAIADENITTSDPFSNELSHPVYKDVFMGTEICYRGCGRYYHYTIRCCQLSHSLKVAGSNVIYIVHQGQIFLEKCAAFAVMGKMCVVRFSDYRTVDRQLGNSGMEVLKHFLYEHSLERSSEALQGGRRTHISMDAFITLVQYGFALKTASEAINVSLLKIVPKINLHKSKCLKYEGADRVEVKDEDLLTEPDHDDEASTSSGIESGGASDSPLSSGKNSPVNEMIIDDVDDMVTATIMDNFRYLTKIYL
jgi:hypothetical protein